MVSGRATPTESLFMRGMPRFDAQAGIALQPTAHGVPQKSITGRLPAVSQAAGCRVCGWPRGRWLLWRPGWRCADETRAVTTDEDVFEPSWRPAARCGGHRERVSRPWLGVRFVCAGAYVRVYRSRCGTRYRAVCPRCGQSVHFAVGPAGTHERFFDVDCGVC